MASFAETYLANEIWYQLPRRLHALKEAARSFADNLETAKSVIKQGFDKAAQAKVPSETLWWSTLETVPRHVVVTPMEDRPAAKFIMDARHIIASVTPGILSQAYFKENQHSAGSRDGGITWGKEYVKSSNLHGIIGEPRPWQHEHVREVTEAFKKYTENKPILQQAFLRDLYLIEQQEVVKAFALNAARSDVEQATVLETSEFTETAKVLARIEVRRKLPSLMANMLTERGVKNCSPWDGSRPPRTRGAAAVTFPTIEMFNAWLALVREHRMMIFPQVEAVSSHSRFYPVPCNGYGENKCGNRPANLNDLQTQVSSAVVGLNGVSNWDMTGLGAWALDCSEDSVVTYMEEVTEAMKALRANFNAAISSETTSPTFDANGHSIAASAWIGTFARSLVADLGDPEGLVIYNLSNPSGNTWKIEKRA